MRAGTINSKETQKKAKIFFLFREKLLDRYEVVLLDIISQFILGVSYCIQ